MKKIRATRVKRYRKRYKTLIIGFQVLVIWYSLIIVGMQLNTFTNAAFNDIENVKNSIHVDWDTEEPDPDPEPEPPDNVWEKSSMKEVSISGSCKKGISAIFTNTGKSVNHELTKYEVYWIKKGNPKKGKLVETGEYPIPDKGETVTITYQPEKNGVYKIRAHQEVGHPGNKGPWSDSISVTDCNTDTSSNEKKSGKQVEEEVMENENSQDTNSTKTVEDKKSKTEQQDAAKPSSEEKEDSSKKTEGSTESKVSDKNKDSNTNGTESKNVKTENSSTPNETEQEDNSKIKRVDSEIKDLSGSSKDSNNQD